MDTSNIEKYLIIGANNRHWYRECEQLFVDIFGRDKLHVVCKLFAATSINTSLKANIALFRRALREIELDIPVGTLTDGKGKTLGYLPNIKNQITRVREGKELSGIKISAFAKAMSGDKDAVVVDVWLARAFGIEKRYLRYPKDGDKSRGKIRSAGVGDKDFHMVEAYCRELAAAKGMEAREISSMIWAGVRIEATGDTETHYKEILQFKLKNLFDII